MMNIIAHMVLSKGVNVEEIRALTERIQDLDHKVTFWGNLYIGAVLVTVLAGIFLFWVQFMSMRRSSERDAFQKLLSKVKDEQLTSENANRDVRIAEVKADADVQISRVKAESDEKIEAANRRSGEVQAEADRKAAELRASNLATEEKLEKERETRLELERSIAPRSFVIKVAQTPNSNFEELKPFAGTKVIFEVLTDSEARRVANDIGNLVGFAGWKVVSINANPNLWAGFFDGVSIVPPPGFPPFEMPGLSDQKALATRQKTKQAADTLALWLMEQHWKASVRINIDEAGKVPDDTIKIFIGFKPNPFFEPDWVKEMERQYQQMLKQQKKMEDMRSKPPNQN